MGHIVGLYIADGAGLPMKSLQHVEAVQGLGLRGDRYALETGAYSKKNSTIRHVTLISREAIDAANRELEVPFLDSETRRNIVVEGIDLNDLIGKKIRLANHVYLIGTELAHPCKRPSALAKKKGFDVAFAGRGGLRCEILNSGVLRIDSNVMIIDW